MIVNYLQCLEKILALLVYSIKYKIGCNVPEKTIEKKSLILDDFELNQLELLCNLYINLSKMRQDIFE